MFSFINTPTKQILYEYFNTFPSFSLVDFSLVDTILYITFEPD